MQPNECLKIDEIPCGGMEGTGLDAGTDRVSLQAAFLRFTEASRKLEDRYEALRNETEELRKRLREKDAEIARSARLAMLGETAAAIAHEVRNPLGSIKLFVSLLRQDLEGESSSLELLDGVDKSLCSIDNVVSNILQFARSQTPSMSPLNIHSIIQEQVKVLVPAGKTEVSVNLDLKGMPFVIGNEHGLRQVIYNLLLNSLQAMHYRGEIAISASSRPGGGIDVKVRDNGPGIPESYLATIFEPFVTSKNEGTGLGLAIVKKILAQHGAQIEARNEGGAMFTITFPQRVKEECK